MLFRHFALLSMELLHNALSFVTNYFLEPLGTHPLQLVLDVHCIPPLPAAGLTFKPEARYKQRKGGEKYNNKS
jgi:hypothetical protein